MSTSQTTEKDASAGKKAKPVKVHVNNKKVELPKEHVTGLEIKKEAIEQGVAIALDFLLTREAHKSDPARVIGDEDTIHVDDHDKFVANDVDDDS